MSDKSSILSLDFPEADIAVLTFDDPNKSVNILSRPVLEELDAQLSKIENRTDLAGLIIRSGKKNNFFAGADVREFVADIDQPSEEVIAMAKRGHALFGRLSKCPFVTVAAIRGICVGGGAEIAIWCDRRIMARDPKTSYSFPEVKIGIIPGWGGTARIPRIIGLGNAVEIISSGDSVDTDAALAMGLAEVAPAERMLEASIALVRAEQQSEQYLKDREEWSKPINISETELGFLGATANAFILGQTKGQYPAPIAALEVMLEAAGADIETALDMEAKAFSKLFGGSVNRALLNVFFLGDRNKKVSGPEGVEPLEIKSATVLGAGTMGQGIAAANAKRCIPVALGDMSSEAVARGVQGVIKEVSFNKKTRSPDAKKALEFIPMVNGSTSDDELAASDIVVEAIYENADAKRELYARLEPKLGEKAILCSNTSTIPITDLAKGLKRPERFCGLHFFNPVRRMPLVEVIRGEQTSDETIATVVAYSKQIGKSPIIVNDGPGFVVNRILLPYMNESLLLLEEGASIKAVDRAATKFGMPMGPISLYDTVGLDIAMHAGGVMQRAFPDRVVPAKILESMLEADRKGKKNGKGFFDYPTDSRGRTKPKPSDEVQQIIASCQSGEATADLNIEDRLFLPMLLEATRLLEDNIVDDPRDVDLGLIYGIGYPPFKGGLLFWADSIGTAEILERLKPYAGLGKRYEPTEMLLEFAKTNRKFYNE